MNKTKLTKSEVIAIASMLFGMFFGAGNLIFPAHVGQAAGSNVWLAWLGLLITGVGFPLLAVTALGISRSDGLLSLSSRVGSKYGKFFTCALYLTIGPFFAIPRCATVPYSVAVEPMFGTESPSRWYLTIFSLIFFAIVLFFSLRPSGILTWIGKILNPVFLVCLGAILVASLISPMGEISSIAPDATYSAHPFFTGFLEGYNTMDALAGLAFGIVVVTVIRECGITEPAATARNTVKAGVFSCLLMAVIYLAVSVVCAQSRGVFPLFENGGSALGAIADHYFGKAGALVLACTFTFACLKTSIALVTSCSETFRAMFPSGPSYKAWAIIFSAFSFLIANVGLTAIIAYAVPVLMFLYPLAITLILLTLFSRLFHDRRCVYVSVTACTLLAAILDFINALPKDVITTLHLDVVLDFAKQVLPFFSLGLGWIVPAAIGLIIGLVYAKCKKA